MPYKDLEKRRAYHQEYQRKYRYRDRLKGTPEGLEKLKSMKAALYQRWLNEKDTPAYKAKRAAWEQTRYWKNREARLRQGRNNELRRKYGISLEQYSEMYEKQDGLCLICAQPEKAKGKGLSVDHCHTTGAVRGLLCHSCNVAIGLMKEDPERLIQAALYVDEIELRS